MDNSDLAIRYKNATSELEEQESKAEIIINKIKDLKNEIKDLKNEKNNIRKRNY